MGTLILIVIFGVCIIGGLALAGPIGGIIGFILALYLAGKLNSM